MKVPTKSLMLAVAVSVAVARGDDNKSNLTGVEVLPRESQKQLLIASVMARKGTLQNVHVKAISRKYVAEFHNDVTDTVLRDLGAYHCAVWQIAGSYRVESDWFFPSTSNVPTVSSVSGFNATTGESRATATSTQRMGQFGRLDVQHDPNIFNNRAIYLLNPVTEEKSDLLPYEYLLSYSEELEVVGISSDGLVESRMNQRAPGGSEQALGERRMWFDPSKQFLLVRMQHRFEKPSGYWEEWHFTVADALQSGGVWFPKHLREVARASFMESGLASVNDTYVSEFEVGAVNPADLDVSFSKGMRVADGIQGISYVADGTGGAVPGTAVSLLEGDPRTSSPPTGARFRLALMLVGLSLVALALVVRWRATLRSRLR